MQYDKAIASAKKAIARDPNWIPSYWELGLNYGLTGQYEEAVEILKKGLSIDPDVLLVRVSLFVAYSDSGRDTEAKMEAENIRKLSPNFSAKTFIVKLPLTEAKKEHYLAALRKAGLE